MVAVVSGSASPLLSARLSKKLCCRIIRPEVKRFPDGELYVRIVERVDGEKAVVVQSTAAPQDENLMELLFITDLLRDMGAKEIIAVVPYLAYARQDRRFRPGEALSVKTVCRLIEGAGADGFITVDIHHRETLSHFSIRAIDLTAARAIGEHLKRMRLKRPIVLGADRGAEERARIAALEMGADYSHVEKRRISPEKVEVSPVSFDVRGRDIILLDDIISTGGTIAESSKSLRRMGARAVYAACTHPVLSGNALVRMKRAGVKDVISTDTIEREVSRVSVSGLIAEALG
ncbi:MAG: ribose-phosphate diphosphokinase [Candidatus Hadarchaeales archaeon]